MTKLRLIFAGSMILVGLAACTTGSTPTPGTTALPESSGSPLPTVVNTSIPESAYPSPSGAYPSPSAAP